MADRLPLSPGHSRVNEADLDDLTIKDSQLYWKNERIRTELELSKSQSRIALAVAATTILAGMASIAASIVTIIKLNS